MADPYIFDLRVNPKDFADKIGEIRRYYSVATRKLIDGTAEYTKQIIQLNTPVKTGTTRNSIQIFRKETKDGKTDLRSMITVGSRYPVFHYLDQGTERSRGRFVPKISKRLVNPKNPAFGFHPGIRARNILRNTRKAVEQELGIKVELMLIDWTNVWTTKLPPRGPL